MGVASLSRIRHEKKMATSKLSRRGKWKTRKSTKSQISRDRQKLRKQKKLQSREDEERGRGSGATGSGSAQPMEDVPKRSASAAVKPGEGTGTVGARYAAARVPKAVRISKRGGRRRKPTLRAFGHW
mmetsp:Transcript_28865/g.55690  ORF Transcript_28865/g.55690 Transcript_28865/m.55690 type:complete len:127 (-) Transcript_28865:60-440(-)